jgi:hypothetical protein
MDDPYYRQILIEMSRTNVNYYLGMSGAGPRRGQKMARLWLNAKRCEGPIQRQCMWNKAVCP